MSCFSVCYERKVHFFPPYVFLAPPKASSENANFAIVESCYPNAISLFKVRNLLDFQWHLVQIGCQLDQLPWKLTWTLPISYYWRQRTGNTQEKRKSSGDFLKFSRLDSFFPSLEVLDLKIKERVPCLWKLSGRRKSASPLCNQIHLYKISYVVELLAGWFPSTYDHRFCPQHAISLNWRKENHFVNRGVSRVALEHIRPLLRVPCPEIVQRKEFSYDACYLRKKQNDQHDLLQKSPKNL